MKTIDALQNSGNRLSRRCGLISHPAGLITLLTISSNPPAVIPPPDGGYPRFNTAEVHALFASTPALQHCPWLPIAREQRRRQFQHRDRRGSAPSQHRRRKYGLWHDGAFIQQPWRRQQQSKTAALLNTPRQQQHGLWSNHPLNIPLPTATRPWVLARSLAIQRAASTPPSEPLCFLTTPKVTTTRPSV